MESSFSRIVFRSLWPILTFFFVLSIGLNAFLLLYDRIIDTNKDRQAVIDESETIGLERGARSFGSVSKGFVVTPVASVPSATVPGVRGYELPEALLPNIPPTFLLYRDQGVAVDPALVTSVLHTLGVPPASIPAHSFLKSMTLRSLNRKVDVFLDLENRVLMLTQAPDPSLTPPPSQRADDAEVTALARSFLGSVGVDDTGTPVVIDEPGSSTSPGRTFVVWYASLNGAPLLDERMEPFARVTVQVGRVSHRVVAVLVSLLDAGALTRSPYPTASLDLLSSGLLNGGMRPLPASSSAKAPTATYQSADLVYVLSPANEEYPLYLVPVLRASYEVPGCPTCQPYTGTTYVPVLDPQAYAWLPGGAGLASSASAQ